MYYCDFRGISQDRLCYRKLNYGFLLQKNEDGENELLFEHMKGP